MNAACRDSAAIGAGYEDDLKSGKYRKAGCVEEEEEGTCVIAIAGFTRQLSPTHRSLVPCFVMFSFRTARKEEKRSSRKLNARCHDV